jgi:hypothetical protein
VGKHGAATLSSVVLIVKAAAAQTGLVIGRWVALIGGGDFSGRAYVPVAVLDDPG